MIKDYSIKISGESSSKPIDANLAYIIKTVAIERTDILKTLNANLSF